MMAEISSVIEAAHVCQNSSPNSETNLGSSYKYNYSYDDNDNLRNNRPDGPVKIKSDSKDELVDRSSTGSVVLIKTPRTPSSLDDFEVISTIGTGSYGTCRKIRRKTDGKIMVWKEMDYGSMTESEKQMLVSEVNLLRELRHQHIVRYHDRIIDRTRAVIYIIMEYCQGGDLATIIAKNRKDGTHVDENFVWKILIQTTLALKECHRRKNGRAVLHRDLKPANVFLDAESNVKLGDFGLARVLQHESSFAQTYVGTPYYMSPELVNNMSYNEKSDIWSLGCMLYELCALIPPFVAPNQCELNRKIRIGDFPKLPQKYYSKDLDFVIRRMIQVEVSKRPSIDSILLDSIVQRKQRNLSENKGADNKHCCPYVSHDNSSSKQDRMETKWEEYKAKMKQLELKEKELESRERSVALREKLAEEKMKRAMEMYQKYHHHETEAAITPRVSSSAFARSPSPDEESLLVSTHSCLSKGSKDPDSPKKHVTFHDYLNGKENLRRKSPYSGLALNTYTGLYSVQDTPAWDSTDREHFRDRFFKDKFRLGLGTRDRYTTKFTSHNLLYFR